jgi:hypothetical protein
MSAKEMRMKIPIIVNVKLIATFDYGLLCGNFEPSGRSNY